jgi:hypothetical protein
MDFRLSVTLLFLLFALVVYWRRGCRLPHLLLGVAGWALFFGVFGFALDAYGATGGLAVMLAALAGSVTTLVTLARQNGSGRHVESAPS